MLKVVHSVLLLPPLYRTRRIVLGPQPNSPLITHGHRNFPDGRRGDAELRNIHFLTRSPASKADVTTKYCCVYRLLIENWGHVFCIVLQRFQIFLDICGAHARSAMNQVNLLQHYLRFDTRGDIS